jgi:RecA-family ATPase
VGLTMLAGRPKQGKSWLALQIAVAVGTGGKLLGLDVPKGKALYLALEDSARRLKSRLESQQAPTETEVKFYEEWKALTEGGIIEIFEQVDAHGYTLVIIDTISRVLGRADQMDQGEMTSILGGLQRLAGNRGITVLLVDHHRKSGGNGDGDVIDDVMGATSKVGVADAAMGLYRQRGERTATLKVTGRDIDDREMAIVFDTELCCWQYEGEVADVKSNTVQAKIVEALQQLGGKATTTKIARFLGKQPSNISSELNELVMKGRIARGKRQGREIPYTLMGEDDEGENDEEEIS